LIGEELTLGIQSTDAVSAANDVRALEDQINSLTTSVEESTSAAARGFGATEEQVKQLNKELGNLKKNASLNALRSQSSNYVQALRVARNAQQALARAMADTPAEKLNKEIEALRQNTALIELRAQSEEYAEAVRAAKKAQDALNDSVSEAEEEVDDLTRALREMRDEKAFIRLRLQSKEYRKEVRELAKEQRRLELASMPALERMSQSLEFAENLSAGLDLATSSAEAFWEAFTIGAERADLERTARNIEGISSASERAQGLAPTTGRGAALRAGLQAVELGINDADAKLLTELAQVAARRQVALEGGDISEVTTELIKQFQEGFASGQITQPLEALGESAVTIERAQIEAARASGIMAESLTAAQQQQILLQRGLDASTSASLRFSVASQESAASVSNFAADLQGSFGAALANLTGAGSGGVGDVEGIEARLAEVRERIETAEQSIAETAGEALLNSANSIVGLVDNVKLGRDILADVNKLREQEAKLLESLASAQAERVRAEVAAFTQQFIPQIEREFERIEIAGGGEGAERLSALGDVLFQIAEARAEVAGQGAEAEAEAAAAQIEVLQRELKINEATARRLALETEIGTVLRLGERVRSTALAAEQKGIDARIKILEAEIKSGRVAEQTTQTLANGEKIRTSTFRTLSRQEVAQRKAAIAELQIQRSLSEQLKERSELGEILDDENIRQQVALAAAKARNEESLRFGDSLTEAEKKSIMLENKLIDVKTQILGATDSQLAFRQELGKVAVAKLFNRGAQASTLFGKTLENNVRLMSTLQRVSGRVLGTFDAISGGAVLTDNFLRGLLGDVEKATEPKKSSGPARERVDLTSEIIAAQIDAATSPEQYEQIIRDNFSGLSDLIFTQASVALFESNEQIRAGASVFGMGFADAITDAIDPDDVEIFSDTFLDKVATEELAKLEEWSKEQAKRIGKDAAGLAQLAELEQLKFDKIFKELRQRQLDSILEDATELGQAAGTLFNKAVESFGESAEAAQTKVDRFAAIKLEVELERRPTQVFDASFLGAIDGEEGDDGLLRRTLTRREVEIQKAQEALMRQRDKDLAELGDNLEKRTIIQQHYNDRIRALFEERREIEREEQAKILAQRREALEASAMAVSEIQGQVRSQLDSMRDSFSSQDELAFSIVDAAQRSMVAVQSVGAQVLANQEAVVRGQMTSDQALVSNVSSVASAAGNVATAVIKNEAAIAGIKGAVQLAEAAASFATGNAVKGTAHLFAAGQFFAAAAISGRGGGRGGGGGGGAARSSTSAAAQATAVSQTTTIPRRDTGPDEVVNIFVDPLTGRAVVDTINADSARNRRNRIDSRWVSNTVRRTDI